MKGIFKAIGFGLLTLFSINAWSQSEVIITESSEPPEERYKDEIVSKSLMYNSRILPYGQLREADVPWEKRIWRIIDTREKLNLPFVYPENPLFSILSEAAKSGEIKVFEDDGFKEMLAPDEVSSQLVSTDTSIIYDPETYEEQVKVTESVLNPLDIKRYRVKEIWFFDEGTSRMDVRILGIAPIRDYYDEDTGAFKYEAPMFWIYYPEAREVLSRHRAFNEFNDASPYSWDDVFQTRRFSSYIYKQSNVLDARLVDLYPLNGVDRLMEAEKIEAELFNFEHDLWSY